MMNNIDKIKIIENWLIKSIKNKSWQTNDDSHIDEIFSNEILQSKYISTSIATLEIILKLLDIKYEVLLFITLVPQKKKINLESIYNLSYFENMIDDSTPSFYLQPVDINNFEEIKKLPKLSINGLERFDVFAEIGDYEKGFGYSQFVYILNKKS